MLRKLPKPEARERSRRRSLALVRDPGALARFAAGTGRVLQDSCLSWAARPAKAPGAPAKRFSWAWRSFVALAIVPALASSVYFGAIASSQFESEMRFAVRGTTEALPGSDALAASGLGVASNMFTSNQDVFAVAEYIGSRAMLDDLSGEIDLRGIYSKPSIDWWARFEPSAAEEDLLRYWRTMVRTTVEVFSGIVTVTVKAFSPEDAVRLASAIRTRCEIAADRLLAKARDDAVARAAAEAKAASAQLAVRQAALERFRNSRRQIDPMALAQSLGDSISALRQDLVDAEVKLDTARASLGADAPQIKTLAASTQILAAQIAALQAKVTSTGSDSQAASAVLAAYDRLDVEKSLAEQAAVLAERQLDNRQSDASRHHIFLAAIQDPTLPQSSAAPKRLQTIAFVSLSALSVWLLIGLIAANVRDHTL